MLPKRTVEEWVTVARISRDTRHLFVEGETDARILFHALGYPEDVDVRSGKEVDVSDEDSHPFWGGFKLRLIKLAKAAAETLGHDNLRCLIDSDFASLVSYVDRPRTLVLTPFANLLSSTLSEEWLRGFMLKAYGLDLTAERAGFIWEALRFAFVCRYVAGNLDAPKKSATLSDHVAYKNGSLSLDKVGFVVRTFDIRKEDAGEIIQVVGSFDEILMDDRRQYINTNDLFDLLYVVLRKMGKIAGSTPRDSLRQAFLGAMDDAACVAGLEDLTSWALAKAA